MNSSSSFDLVLGCLLLFFFAALGLFCGSLVVAILVNLVRAVA